MVIGHFIQERWNLIRYYIVENHSETLLPFPKLLVAVDGKPILKIFGRTNKKLVIYYMVQYNISNTVLFVLDPASLNAKVNFIWLWRALRSLLWKVITILKLKRVFLPPFIPPIRVFSSFYFLWDMADNFTCVREKIAGDGGSVLINTLWAEEKCYSTSFPLLSYLP